MVLPAWNPILKVGQAEIMSFGFDGHGVEYD